MIHTRRAIRNFKDKPVPRELLEKIVEAISSAPPGFPPLKNKIIVVQDSALIRDSLPNMVRLYDKLVAMMKKPINKFFIKKELGEKKFKTLQEHLIPLLISRLPALKNGTEDTITRNAPAMILFLADKDEEDISQDISIAATYGMLAAHSLGLGGSIMDLIPPAINKDNELRKLFCIPYNHEVVTSIIIGYPKYKYQRGIKRNLKSVKWI
jgi:nitroreductase